MDVDDHNEFSVLGSLTTGDPEFKSDRSICLDLPDNLQAWLDKAFNSRKKKGNKSLSVSDVEDNP